MRYAVAGPSLLAQLWRFRAYGRPHRRRLIGGIGLRVGELAADLAQPWPLAIVIDGVLRHRPPSGVVGALTAPLPGRPLALLVCAALAALVIALFSGSFDYFGDRVMNSAGERITSEVRRDVFAVLQELPMPFHDEHTVGELTSRVVTDTDRIEDGLVDVFSTLVPGVITLTGYAVAMLLVDWRLGLVACVAAPVVFATATRYTRLTRESSRQRRRAEGMLAGLTAEVLTGMRTVHATGSQAVHSTRFAQRNTATLHAGLRSVDLRARFTPLLEGAAAVGTAAILLVGGYGVLDGWWTVGLLVVVLAYLRDMLRPLRALSRLSITLTTAAASAERVSEILDQPRRAASRAPQARSALEPAEPPATGRITLRGVTFGYGDRTVVRDVDLEIGPGERLVLQGPNGAGKSSLLALLAGLYEPDRGQVCLDGVSFLDLTDARRHRAVSVVLQDTFLFSGTLRENLRLTRPDASDSDVRRVADAAMVSDFATDLAQGLDAPIGEGGIGLSGGQRQRVGIARALLADTPVVLLDEPTAGLDPDAEKAVVTALERLMVGRTVVMTTHRPELLRLATRHAVVRHGRVVEVTPKMQRLAP
ncbi:ABC transporter ATP-binding protein [Terrabacter carboxydivorans]|uniref:ABC transporter ATP-binding protein n=1 Tax=Terrabacter carboxydivorans TaxID=619730 RepID=A0ABP5ZS27_9MICO